MITIVSMTSLQGKKTRGIPSGSRVKITQVKTLGIQRDMTLKDLFCASLSRTILMYYWEEITKGLYVLNIDSGSCEKLINNIRANFPRKRPNTILVLISFVQTCQQISIRSKK